jgi:hypothetical protein
MIPCIFWTNSGPGIREVPDSLPIMVEIATITERKSLRGETFKKVEMREFYRQLYAAPLTRTREDGTEEDTEFTQWAMWPTSKAILTGDEPYQVPVLLMVIYTEWQPK